MSKGIGKQLSILTSVAMVMTWSVILAEVSPPVLGQLADTPWPMFQRDPQHTGRSPYLGIQKPAKKWHFAIGDETPSSPAIGSDGTIYVGSGSDGKLYAIGDTTPPTVPVLSFPANNSVVNTSTPTFDYQDSTDEETAVDGYQIHVDDESTFFSPVLDEYLTESHHTPGTPLEEKTHFWRVRAKDKAGNWSDWSEVWQFTVALQIIAYPNPCYVDGTQTLRIVNLPRGSRVHIYTISGELVRTLNDDTEVTPEDGSAIATWDLRNDTGSLVAQGVYLYFVPEAMEGDRAGKIVVVK